MGIINILKNRRTILGMNERNLSYIKKYNQKRYRKIAQDKILTKKLLTKHNIPTPKLIAGIRNFEQLDKFGWSTLPKSFVIKPVHGVQGAGIEIFYNQDKLGNWIKADRSKYSLNDLKKRGSDILDGKFTPYSDPDAILIEERVKAHKAFKYYAYKGTPDIRIIVFKSIPVMAYLRLPTKESQGKANMAMGAIGAGIDMSNGRTTTAVYGKSNGGKGVNIDRIPGTKLPISGLKIPYWDKLLRIAVQSQRASNLGFLAIDFLIDRIDGPKVVELTARPGLSIQIANQTGLRWRLRKTRGITVKSVNHAIRLSKDLFGGEIEEEIERVSGKELIGIIENITLYGINDKSRTTKAKIDTGAGVTSIDERLAIELGYADILKDFNDLDLPKGISEEELKPYEEILLKKYSYFGSIMSIKSSHGTSIRLKIKIKLKLGDLVFDTYANIYKRANLNYKVIVGCKSLKQFLIEPK